MDMNWQDVSLAAAGIIGSSVAVVHGILVERLMIRPFRAFLSTEKRVAAPVGRLVPVLLHFSTISWFLGGLLLIAAGCCLDGDVRRAAALFVGSLYLFGAVANLWATRGRHPGWMAMAAALILIFFGL